MKNKKPICCFCGKECENIFGNNPYPASKNEEDRCCDFCNMTIVLPKRLEALWSKRKDWEVSKDGD